jgi:hypothetical protein
MRRAIVSSTLGHDYSFLCPIAALCWRDRIGFEPSLFLVGTEAEWVNHKYGRVVMGAISTHSIHHVFVPHMDGVEDSTVAQCVRQHAGCHPFSEDDILTPSDADLLPICKEYYWLYSPEKYVAATFYCNAYRGEEHYHLPSCHFSMRAKHWRKIMGYSIEPIENAMSRTFNEYGLPEKMKLWNAEVERAHAAKEPADSKYWWPIWFTDELTSSKKLIGSKYWPDQVLKVPRDGHPPKDRLDRSSWPYFANLQKLVDCHSLRPGWSGTNWPKLSPVLKALLPTHKEWLDKYRADFREAIGVDA